MTATPESLLRLTNVNVYYDQVHVLKNLSLHLNPGEIVTLIGANGAGKTTTLNSISGLLRPQEGQVCFKGEEITGRPPSRLVKLGIVQVPEGRQLFRPLSVIDNLRLGGYLSYKSNGKKQMEKEIEEVCAQFPILKERRQQFAGTLSGGEQQMLAIAMALMCKPELLLLDEPSMGLAPLVVKDILAAIADMQKKRGLTVLLVEQNARAALKIADRAYVLEIGRIIMEGEAAEMLQNREVQRAYLGKDKKEIWE